MGVDGGRLVDVFPCAQPLTRPALSGAERTDRAPPSLTRAPAPFLFHVLFVLSWSET